MEQKLYNEELISRLMEMTGLSREVVTNYFGKMIDTLKRHIQKDGFVEIDGFGAFKLVDMKERASVNINTGERIVIPSYKKLTFVQSAIGQESLAEVGEQNDAEQQDAAIVEENLAGQPEVAPLMTSPAEAGMDEDETITEESTNEGDGRITVEPVAETPVDEFSGIDTIISTPESIDDLIDRVKEAEDDQKRIKSDIDEVEHEILLLQQKLAELKNADGKKAAAIASLQELLTNMEQNRPAFVDRPDTAVITEQSAHVEEQTAKMDEATPRIAAAVDSTVGKPVRKNHILLYSLCAILLLALLAIVFFMANSENKQLKEAEKMEQMAQKQRADSLRRDSIVHAKSKEPAKPLIEKVLFDGSTPLEILVTKHYGEHDIVFRVIRYNKEHGVFDDWRKIPVGTELLFPDFEQLDKKNNK